MSALELDRIVFTLGGARVLDGATLTVATGETVCLLGPSGSGKTSLVRVALGLATAESGEVRIAGRNARALLPEARGLAVVFQDLGLWPHMSARAHLDFVLAARSVAREARPAKIERALARVGLADKASRRPHELSGGERQRIAIARALVVEPSCLLFDEPLASLDVHTKKEIASVLRSSLADQSSLYVTHDPREARALGARLAILEAGKVTWSGPLAEIDAAPRSPFVAAVREELA